MPSLAPGFPRRLGHFQGPSKANNKEPKQKSSCAVSFLLDLSKPPGVSPHTVRPSAAARAGAAGKLGCENGLGRAEKCFSVYRRAQSTAGHPRRRQRQRQHFWRAGTGCRGCAWVTPRAGGEQGGGAATAVPWAGPCSHHLGDAEGTKDCSRSADTLKAPGRSQPRAALTIPQTPRRWGVRAKHPELSAAGTLEPKVPSGGCPQPRLVVAAGRQLPDLPGVAERGEERAAAGGSDGRRGSPELRRDQQRLKFLLSRCPFSGSVVCGFPPPFPRLPVSSLSFPAREHLKGPRGPFHASGYTLQTPPWQVLLVNISIHEPGCPTAPSGEKSNCSGSQIRANGNLACFSCHPWLPCTFLQMEPPSQRLQKSSGPA